jgi:integrase
LAKIALTDAAVQRLKLPNHGQTDIIDKGYPGLLLRLSSSGRRSWCMFYRYQGKPRRFTFGRYPQMMLQEARETWRRAREELQAGRDPSRLRPSRKDLSFISIAEQWLALDQGGKRTAKEAERIIRKYCAPLHDLRIDAIVRADLRDLIRGIAAEGKITMARRVRGRLQRLFNWATSEDLLSANPMSGLNKPGYEVERERVLTDRELVEVWRGCEAMAWPFGPAIQLLILTGARRSEIGDLRWAEVEEDQIVIPASRYKTDQPHIIPLSEQVKKIIVELPHISGSEYVFTTTGTNPVSGWTNAKRQLPTLDQPWVLHDLRRTMATGLQRVGIALQVTEAVLGHVAGSRAGVAGIYRRYDHADKKRAALDAWGRHVESLLS